ncbi:PREDICTED: sodium channel subunit beta-2-like [Poecilia mexicana]|uniref:sodium channel subunit beta-2-like n=1 Tax=Poecilia mexicana TaxID=48701 RepID=UPI00072DEF4C|nr:PREDICTED: sodium channel subunit beta-2-like [Poecilia mexicana]
MPLNGRDQDIRNISGFLSLFPLPDQYEVVGHETIHAKVGDDVILPCHVKPPFDVNNLTIEWRFKDKKIYLHRSQKRDNKTSDPEYKTRTSLFHKNLTKGDISLILTDVTKEDEGNYICFVPKLESQVKKGNVTLRVVKVENLLFLFVTGWKIGLGVGIPVGIIIIIAGLCYRQRKRIFQCLSNNNSRHEQRRNDGEQNGNGNPEDKAEEMPLQVVEQPNQRVDESSPLS